MKTKLIILMLLIATVGWGETNILATIAANMVCGLTHKWITSPYYPTQDEESGIGQGTGVQYCGSKSNAPSRIYGIVVSRIITDRSGGKNHGEKWCLVEFGNGPAWHGYPLADLTPIAISKALRDFPPAGMETVKAMLKNGRQ